MSARRRVSMTLAVVLTATLLLAWGWRRLGPCKEGSARRSLTVALDYIRRHPDVIRIRLCVRGGGCAIQRDHPGVAQTWSMDFGRLIPAAVARQGPEGAPAHIRMTAYSKSGAVVSAAATLSPVRRLPQSRCELRGYMILAEFAADGTLGYYKFA